jgi:hypothetical protein
MPDKDQQKFDLPSENLISYIMSKTQYKDPDFVAASIIASRYDDPNVPIDITKVLRGDM